MYMVRYRETSMSMMKAQIPGIHNDMRVALIPRYVLLVVVAVSHFSVILVSSPRLPLVRLYD